MSKKKRVHFAHGNWGITKCGWDILGPITLETTTFKHLVTCKGCLKKM